MPVLGLRRALVVGDGRLIAGVVAARLHEANF
jgi:hypothetical protein